MTTPPSPCGTLSEVSRTSRAFSLKIARISFSSAVSSVSPFGVTLPTSRSPEPTSAPMRTMPRSSRFRSDSSRAVRDVAGDLLVAELRGAGVDLVLLDVDRGELVVLHEALGQDDRVLEVVALPGHEGDQAVLAQRDLALIGRGAVGQDVALLHRHAGLDARLLVDERALVRPHVLVHVVLVVADDDLLGVDVVHGAGVAGQDDVARVDRRAALGARADQRGLRLQQRDGLGLHVRAHQRAVGVVVLEERDQRRRDRPDLLRRHVHQVDVLRRGEDELAVARAARDVRALELAGLLVDLGVRLRDDLLVLLVRVEVDDLVGHDAVLDDPVGGREEAELGDLGVARQRADQADVRTLRRLDRAHAAVVGRVDVAHLDGCALAREAAGAERRQAAAVPQARERVRLVHELRQLRGAEELLERRHDRADVDDRLRGDRVGVLGGEALAHDALHAVEADPERFLDQLAHRAQTAVAEVLVLVEAVGDRVALDRRGLEGVVLDRLARVGVDAVLRDAQVLGQGDELLDQLDDVVVGQDPLVEVLVQAAAAS